MYINVKYNLYYKKFEGSSGFNNFNFVNIICFRVAEAIEACAAHISEVQSGIIITPLSPAYKYKRGGMSRHKNRRQHMTRWAIRCLKPTFLETLDQCPQGPVSSVVAGACIRNILENISYLQITGNIPPETSPASLLAQSPQIHRRSLQRLYAVERQWPGEHRPNTLLGVPGSVVPKDPEYLSGDLSCMLIYPEIYGKFPQKQFRRSFCRNNNVGYNHSMPKRTHRLFEFIK